MAQTVIVYIIGGLLAVYLFYRIYRIFSRKEYDKLCGGCPLSDECAKIKKERKNCPEHEKFGKGDGCCH